MVLRSLLHGLLICAFVFESTAQTIRFEEDSSSLRYGQVIIENFTTTQLQTLSNDNANWAKVLRVFTNRAFIAHRSQPVLGTYSMEDSTVGFKPRFAFEPGVPYLATSDLFPQANFAFSPNAGKSPLPPTTFIVYPSSSRVPANILRFYIYFDTPMGTKDPYRFIHILGERGDTLKHSIYPAEPALWSPDRKRLTVLLNPGRIKRGLSANDRWGLPLIAGQKYKLVINKDIADQWGSTLAESVIHPLEVTEIDYQSPELKRWNLTVPDANSLDPLKVVFDEPLDHGQCQRWINIQRNNQSVAGTIVLGANEHQMTFIPEIPWSRGTYQVMVFNNLEDRSGNSLRKPFEVEISASSEKGEARWEAINFDIK
jgi:hypothetical protein